ncbi:MAG: hypothetical protein ACYC40_03280 [Patescibacteria group bacterium]
MSLEATHIRFALDLREKYKIKDLNKYISGAIYPDSRYVTEIDRELTHDDKFLLPEFASDDFKKGWQAHKICDLVFGSVMRKLFSDLVYASYDPHYKQEWITSTAIKIIQDIDDLQSFDIQEYIKCLKYTNNPNDEDIKKIKTYNNIMVNLYQNEKTINLEGYINMWLALGPDAKLCEQLRIKTQEFLDNPEIVARIKAIYQEMINSYSDIVNKRIFDKFGPRIA